MGKKLTTKIFIERATTKHGNTYEYDCSDYIDSETKIDVKCKIHGIFSTFPLNHLKGNGCTRCGQINGGAKSRIGIENFINKSNLKHNNKYDYSKCKLDTLKDKVVIICSEHGEFEQVASYHISGRGCYECGRNICIKAKRIDFEEFTERSNKIHNSKYLYNKDTYTKSTDLTTITCPIHGDFEQIGSVHLQGCGCTICGSMRTVEKIKQRWSTNYDFLKQCLQKNDSLFLNKAKLVHGDRYNYDDVNYVNSHTPVKIICSIHGSFEQSPSNHLSGKGCKDCGYLQALEKGATGWSKTDWVQLCEKNNILYPIVYIIKLQNGVENFIKIGMTKNVDKRFYKMPYDITPINKIIGSPEQIYDLEKKLHKLFKKYKYIPLQKFGGHTECFSTDILKDLNFQMFLNN